MREFPMVVVFVPLIFVLAVVALVFWIRMLVDCAANEPAEGNDKVVWVLIIIFAGLIGALIYAIARRPRRIQLLGR